MHSSSLGLATSKTGIGFEDWSESAARFTQVSVRSDTVAAQTVYDIVVDLHRAAVWQAAPPTSPGSPLSTSLNKCWVLMLWQSILVLLQVPHHQSQGLGDSDTPLLVQVKRWMWVLIGSGLPSPPIHPCSLNFMWIIPSWLLVLLTSSPDPIQGYWAYTDS